MYAEVEVYQRFVGMIACVRVPEHVDVADEIRKVLVSVMDQQAAVQQDFSRTVVPVPARVLQRVRSVLLVQEHLGATCHGLRLRVEEGYAGDEVRVLVVAVLVVLVVVDGARPVFLVVRTLQRHPAVYGAVQLRCAFLYGEIRRALGYYGKIYFGIVADDGDCVLQCDVHLCVRQARDDVERVAVLEEIHVVESAGHTASPLRE